MSSQSPPLESTLDSSAPEPTSAHSNNTKARIALPWVDRNSVINVTLLAASVGLAFWSPWFLLLWPAFLIFDDVLYFKFGKSLFDTEIAVQRGYQFGHVFVDDTSGDDRDLGFNLFDGDLTKSRNQSQRDKWEFMFRQLNLKPGDRLIDVGCGYGDWLNYARSRGVEVTGVNISTDQAAYAQDVYGLRIIARNWKDILEDKELQEELFGKFDAVTFMDTIEHYVPSRYRASQAKQGAIYSSMFNLASRLLKKEKADGRVFISCLHQNLSNWSKVSKAACYLLTRYHSGFYPPGKEGLTRWSSGLFNVLQRWDKTEDYRLTGVLDRKHFQAPKIPLNLRKLLRLPALFLTDPHHIHKWIDIKFDAWMKLFGKDAWSKNYDPDYRRSVSPVTLWWLLLQRSDLERAVEAT